MKCFIRRNTRPIILKNLFQNWAQSVARLLDNKDPILNIPADLLTLKQYLDENYDKPIVLDDLAKLAGISRSYLCHKFRAFFDSSISHYVIRKRMAIAQRLLFDVEMRLVKIANEVGYSDIYQFSKQFKKTFGVSPRRYRSQQQNSSVK